MSNNWTEHVKKEADGLPFSHLLKNCVFQQKYRSGGELRFQAPPIRLRRTGQRGLQGVRFTARVAESHIFQPAVLTPLLAFVRLQRAIESSAI